MPVSKSHGAKCSDGDQFSERPPSHPRGHKRPRSQMSGGSGHGPAPRSQVTSQGAQGGQGWGEPGARPGSWPPPLANLLASGAGPTINIPDSRFGFTSPRASTRYGQVRGNYCSLMC